MERAKISRGVIAGRGHDPPRRIDEGDTALTAANDLAVRRALELAGVEFIDENGGGPGVRLRKRQRAKQSK